MPPVRALAADLPADAPDSSVDSSVDQAVVRLAGEFADQLRPQLIVRVVRDCRRDLGGSPVAALPELVERLARHRLRESIS